MKAFASRGQDWVDVERIIALQPDLDSAYILEHLDVLCELKEEPEIAQRVRKLLKDKL